jgi:hypothetical protein
MSDSKAPAEAWMPTFVTLVAFLLLQVLGTWKAFDAEQAFLILARAKLRIVDHCKALI